MNNRFPGDQRVRYLVSFAIGCCIGVILHYALYRIGRLPLEPFIYMRFEAGRPLNLTTIVAVFNIRAFPWN